MLKAVQTMQKELDVSIATMQDLSDKVLGGARRPEGRGVALPRRASEKRVHASACSDSKRALRLGMQVGAVFEDPDFEALCAERMGQVNTATDVLLLEFWNPRQRNHHAGDFGQRKPMVGPKMVDKCQ